jgi:hypothetical protein
MATTDTSAASETHSVIPSGFGLSDPFTPLLVFGFGLSDPFYSPSCIWFGLSDPFTPLLASVFSLSAPFTPLLASRFGLSDLFTTLLVSSLNVFTSSFCLSSWSFVAPPACLTEGYRQAGPLCACSFCFVPLLLALWIDPSIVEVQKGTR